MSQDLCGIFRRRKRDAPAFARQQVEIVVGEEIVYAVKA